MKQSPANLVPLAFGLVALAALLSVAGAGAASLSSSDTVVVRTYDVRIVGSGTRTWLYPGATPPSASVTMHWTQTVTGLRIRLRRQIAKRPVKGQIAEVDHILPTSDRTGSVSVEVEGSPSPYGDDCPAHATYRTLIRASAGDNAGIGVINVGIPNTSPKCGGEDVVHGGGGVLDPPIRGAPGLCTGFSGLCWEVDAYSTHLGFPLYRRFPHPFTFPMDGIAANRPTATTLRYEEKPNAANAFSTSVKLSVRITFTPRKG